MGSFHTGQTEPATGTYTLAGHMENSTCQPTEEEKRIPLSTGETFPSCRHCHSGAFWIM
jgi:YjzC-like protein